MTQVQVFPVQSRAETKAFIDLPWKLYRDDPLFVPPLRSMMAHLLDTERHPFWKFSQRQIFLARRGSEPVGRIAAIVDGNYNRHYQEKIGAFGFFESENSIETAQALVQTAEDWVRAQGMTYLRGPLNPSVNYEIGVLIEGFDAPPTLGFTHNPPYYDHLLKSCGLTKDKDLYCHRLTWKTRLPDWFVKASERMTRKKNFTIRQARKDRFVDEVRLINQIYNECWAENWGAVPMTGEEIMAVAKEMKPFVDTDLLFFIYRHDEPIGICIVLPDVNRLLMKLNGWLNPWVLFKEKVIRSHVVGLRGYIMGVKEQYRRTGAPVVGLCYLLETLRRKPQYQYVETGWQLEENHAVNDMLEGIGAERSRRFRVYGKTL